MNIPAYRALPILALAVLAACGGGKQNTTTTTTTQSQGAASPAASPAASGAMSAQRVAAVPSSLHCGATAPVWVNPRRHVYHTSSDPLYGRTKHGEYMCVQTARAQGYHPAGGGMRGGKHHKRSGGMMATPEASPT